MTNSAPLETFLQSVKARSPHEPEFHQAVDEVVSSVWATYRSRPELQELGILDRLTEPDRIITFRVTWEDDAGRVQVNRGYRVQFSGVLGPYKGGLRFHPSVNLSVLKFLGFEQIFKNSLTGLPMGGGKGGSDFDPKGRSEREVMRFCQAFMSELQRHIGKDTDVPAGDIGVGSREIGFLFGQYRRLANEWSGALTGKGVPYGGSLIRTEATGYGAVYFAREVLTHVSEGLEGRTAVVSGAGNVALHCVEKLNDCGARVLTLSDSGGFVHDPDGIDAEKLAWTKDLKTVRQGSLSEYAEHFSGATFHEGQRPWGIAADLAFPCATQNELAEEDAEALVRNGVRLVVEGANMPTTAAGAARLRAAGVLFAPGKAANAGGVGVSGLEMSQNSLRVSWTREEVDRRLLDIMKGIHERCVEHGSHDGEVDYARGANVAGFLRVADAMLSHGLY